MSRYKINVVTVKGEFLSYHVSEYKIVDGFVQFIDERTKKIKNFPIQSTEIEEDKDGPSS